MTTVILFHLGVFALLLGSAETGFFLGRRRRETSDAESRSQVTVVEGALLGLLGLLIGFTFSMAVGRFEARQALVVRDATAIGAAYRRAGLLPVEVRAKAQKMLREYCATRLEFFDAGNDVAKAQAASLTTDLLESALWELAREESLSRPTSGTSSFIQALSESFDVATSRRAAVENTVPKSVWVVLFLIAVLSVGSFGFGSGLAGRRLMLQVTLVPILLSVILTLLVDLDDPKQGLIRVSQGSLIRLQDGMK